MEIEIEKEVWENKSWNNPPIWSAGKVYGTRSPAFVIAGPTKQWVRVTASSPEDALQRLVEQVDDPEWLREVYVKFKTHDGLCAVLAANKATPAAILDLLGTSDHPFDDPESRLILGNVLNNSSTTPYTRIRVRQIQGIREVSGSRKMPDKESDDWRQQVLKGRINLSEGVLEVMDYLKQKIQDEEHISLGEEKETLSNLNYSHLVNPLIKTKAFSDAMKAVFTVQKLSPEKEAVPEKEATTPEVAPAPKGFRVHSNGGGLVALTAKVDHTCFVSAGSKVLDEAEVSTSCRIEGFSTVSGNAKISDHTVVRGSTQLKDRAYVTQGALIEDAEISGSARVTGSCYVGSGSLLTEKAVVEGGVTVVNAQVRGHAHLRDKVEVRGSKPRGILIGGVARLEDKAKICGTAEVLDKAMVKDRAKVLGNAKIRDSAVLAGRCVVSENSEVTGEAVIDDQATVSGSAHVTDQARVEGSAEVLGDALVSGESYLCSECSVGGSASVSGTAKVGDRVVLAENARVSGQATLLGGAGVSGEAEVSGNAEVDGMAQVSGNAVVTGSAVIQDQAVVMEHARVSGNATVMGCAVVKGHAFVHDDVDVAGDSVLEEDATFGGSRRLLDYGVDAPPEPPPLVLPEAGTPEPAALGSQDRTLGVVTSALWSSLIERVSGSVTKGVPDNMRASVASAAGSALAKGGGMDGLAGNLAQDSVDNAVHAVIAKVLETRDA